jgi:hypothetical protein
VVSNNLSVCQANVFTGERKIVRNSESISPNESGIMKGTAMNRVLQIGDRQVDEARLADLCRLYCVRELSFFGSAPR